jgi:hypothetical protein
MPGRVGVLNRVIIGITEPIKGLRVTRIRDNGVRLDELMQDGVIVPCVIVVQARCAIVNLPGVLAVGGRGAGGVAGFAPGTVLLLTYLAVKQRNEYIRVWRTNPNTCSLKFREFPSFAPLCYDSLLSETQRENFHSKMGFPFYNFCRTHRLHCYNGVLGHQAIA